MEAVSEQEIKNGSEWKHRIYADYQATVMATFDRDNKSYVVYQDKDGFFEVETRGDFLKDLTPFVREPRVGEVWAHKHSGAKWGVQTPILEREGGLREVVIWNARAGFRSLDIHSFLRELAPA